MKLLVLAVLALVACSHGEMMEERDIDRYCVERKLLQEPTDVTTAVNSCFKDASEFGLENDPRNSLDILKVELKKLIKEYKATMHNVSSGENTERKDEKESGYASTVGENEDGDANETDFYEEVDEEDNENEYNYDGNEASDPKDSSEDENEDEALAEADHDKQYEKDDNEADLNKKDQNGNDGYEARDLKHSTTDENKDDLAEDTIEIDAKRNDPAAFWSRRRRRRRRSPRRRRRWWSRRRKSRRIRRRTGWFRRRVPIRRRTWRRRSKGRPGYATVNGCSVPFGLYAPYKGTFTSSCNGHDRCYYHERLSRRECDNIFYRDMLNSCKVYGTFKRFFCNRFAGLYYAAVRVAGKSHFG
eukprot:Seg2783.2 transcript_id=Seg2783.2/GoldUCD/mRNA.D3Y31 product="hypothetical protein" protein_id=Seg2783.2/GoldUCD/D3Y31